MGKLWDLLIIASVAVWVLALAAEGRIDEDHAAIALVVVVFVVALGRGVGRGARRYARTVVRVGLILASMATLLITVSGGNTQEMAASFVQLVVLLLAIFGLYLIFSAPFRRG